MTSTTCLAALALLTISSTLAALVESDRDINSPEMSSSKFVSPCHGDSITVYNSTSGAVKCQACTKCPVGQGLSVQCSSVQTPETPIVCGPCVLGKTYSSGKDAGACMSCENCEEYRETIKACTLTSKAVCGKCKPGAYQDDLLTGMCQPCSPCCDDQDDLVEPQCRGMPENKQCSVHRSHKCSKVISDRNVSSVRSVETNHTASLVLVSSTTSQVSTPRSTHAAHQETPMADSPSRVITIGAAVGGSLAIVLLLLVICYFLKRMCKHRVNKKGNGTERQETRDNKETGGTSIDLDQLNKERLLPAEKHSLEEESNATSSPVQNITVPDSCKLSVEESEATSQGITETQPPDYNNTEHKLVMKAPKFSCCHTNVEKTTIYTERYCTTCHPKSTECTEV